MEVDPDPWRTFWESLDRLWGTTAETNHQFTGLLAILRGQSGPPKLCIDGREYRRRQRRRTKRKRRR